MSSEGGKPPKDLGGYVKWGGRAFAGFTAWALNVFTAQGFLAALYLAPTEEGLWWPTGTRIVWWVLFYAVTTAWVSRLMWREGELTFTSGAQMWAASHTDAVKRLARRVRWWSGGVTAVIEQRRRHRVTPTAGTVPQTSRTVPDAAADSTPAAA